MSRRHRDLPAPFAALVDNAVGAFFWLSGVRTSRRS